MRMIIVDQRRLNVSNTAEDLVGSATSGDKRW